MDRSRKGRLITLEGGEGAGKSTQLERLAAFLGGIGIPVVKTREPGGTQGAEEIRQLLLGGSDDQWDAMTETLLHCAARRDHVRQRIHPALSDGEWVLSDRFLDSTRAYQGYGHGISHDLIDRLHRAILGDLLPDVTLIFDLDPMIGMDRIRHRGQIDRYERMEAAFHQRIAGGFREIAARAPGRCILIDANRPVDDVTRSVIHAVASRLSLPLPEAYGQ